MTCPTPAIGDFFDHTRSLRQAEIDFLTTHNGVPARALAFDADGVLSTIGVAGATFGSRHFDFEIEEADGANKAMIFLARDRFGEPVDLVAWSPRIDRIASADGRVSLLGENEVLAPRLDEPLSIRRTPLEWLRAGRRGAVIVRKADLWRALDGVSVVAEDIEHGMELRKALAVPPPSIVVRSANVEAEAA